MHTDSVVSLYELHSLDLQEQLTKTTGATVFAITSNIEKDSNGVPTIISRLAVAIKRKLIIYSWHDAELLDPQVLFLYCVFLPSNHSFRNSLFQIGRAL